MNHNKPKNSSRKQQNLDSVDILITPKWAIPSLYAVGILFIVIGTTIYFGTNKAMQLEINYTRCQNLTNENQFKALEAKEYKYYFPLENKYTPRFKKFGEPKKYPGDVSGSMCILEFNIPNDIQGPVYLYYKLTNFYQNHRLYTKSVSLNQLSGKNIMDIGKLEDDCGIMTVIGTGTKEKIIYPCGLIANSQFSDVIHTFNKTRQDPIEFIDNKIIPDNVASFFKKTTYKHTDVVPPPKWHYRFEGGVYNSSEQMYIDKNYRLQAWMKIAALPNFRKIYGIYEKNMSQGVYQVEIDMHFHIEGFGTKSIVITNNSFFGAGKESLIEISYIVVGSICLGLGVLFTLINYLYPRNLGYDSSVSLNED